MVLLWFVVVLILQICGADEVSKDDNYLNIPFFSSCIEPGHEKPCSGHGICLDGYCLCDSLKDVDPLYRYSGKYCEECPYCKGQRCEKILRCLQECQSDLSCDNSFCSLQLKYIPSASNFANSNSNSSLDEKLCLVEDDNGCFISFKYAYENNELLVFGSSKKDCFNGYAITLYVSVGVGAYILSLFALIHCLCDRCSQSRRMSYRRRNVDIVRIPTSIID